MTPLQRETLTLLAQGLSQGDVARLRSVTKEAISQLAARARAAQAAEEEVGAHAAA